MSEHQNRMRDIFFGVIPEEGTPAFEKMKDRHEKNLAGNPELQKEFDKRFKKALNTAIVQDSNGINLNIDLEIRHFLREFNHRAWEHGLRKIPIMFNIMESFFKYDKSIIFFELLEEEDYLLSLYDFLDFYTSKEFNGDIDSIKSNIEEDLIYNFNVGADINEIIFKTEGGTEFVIGGISLIRRKNEVTIFLQTGEVTNTDKESENLEEIPLSNIPGKEKIFPAEDLKLEAVRLNDNPNYWKTMMACRFDLNSQTIDARYIAKDIGQAFIIHTDEIEGFLNNKGEFLTKDLEETYKNQLIKVEEYNSLFELAKATLHLPYYFNQFDSDIIDEDHETKYKGLVKNPIESRKYKNVDNRFKIRTRPLWILNRNKKFSADRLTIRDDKFTVETSGFWRNLTSDEFGMDKKGQQITGKTWVNRKDSYYQANTDELIISKVKKQEYEGTNAGFIYVMRNPVMAEDTYKIGLTTNETKQRAKQLSKTSVPDKFHVMREWAVKDCYKAEKKIHAILDSYRVDPRREFFNIEMEVINDSIEQVIKKINNE